MFVIIMIIYIMKTSTGGAMDHHDNIIKQSSMYNFQALRFKRYLYSYIPIILYILVLYLCCLHFYFYYITYHLHTHTYISIL